ncbi:MAG: universal stress protein [Labilithrix sp.]|nr:universal stress protein [Labilithrix sp.]
MPRKRAVVVGTDFSPAASRAVARAASIAREQGAALHVVHATSRLPRFLAKKLLVDEAAGERCERTALETIVEELRGDGTSASGHLLPGSAAPILRRKAREVDASVVVVGSRGRSLADAILGSTAERVVDGKGPPVLLVRESNARAYREVIVAIDVDSEIRRAFDAAVFAVKDVEPSLLHAFAGPFENKLLLQGVGAAAIRRYRDHSRDEARASVEPRIVDAGLDPSALRLVHGNRRLVLAEAATSGRLLVIDRGDSATRRMLLGSVSRWVIEHSASDLLLV